MKAVVEKYIHAALLEDTAGIGDVTSLATVPIAQTSNAVFLVKEACTIAGIEMVHCIAFIVDPKLHVIFNVKDGDQVSSQQIIGTVEGSTQSILLAERLMLNCMQRMSGIATKTSRLMEMIKAFPAQLLDTRKTTPNNRIAEKWAVEIGGGTNHRFGLYDMVLIKDNHIKAAGSVTEALNRTIHFFKEQNISLPVIVEVKDQTELEEALQFDIVDRILLDNMTPDTVTKMMAINQHKKPLEVSGGVHQGNILAYAATGVDFISIGDLTHHIESIDISLKII